jgi:hypothetical protein
MPKEAVRCIYLGREWGSSPSPPCSGQAADWCLDTFGQHRRRIENAAAMSARLRAHNKQSSHQGPAGWVRPEEVIYRTMLLLHLPSQARLLRLTEPHRDRMVVGGLLAMNILRMILVGVVALSVSVLPMAGGVAAMVSDSTASSQQISADASDHEMSECCPGQSKPGHMSQPDCAASCALNCFVFMATSRSVLITSFATPVRVALSANQRYPDAPPALPFRPPRA